MLKIISIKIGIIINRLREMTMATFGSKNMDIAVSASAVLSGLISAAAGYLWGSVLLFIVACLPWLRIVTASMVTEHRIRIDELTRTHEDKVRTLQAEVKRLKSVK